MIRGASNGSIKCARLDSPAGCFSRNKKGQHAELVDRVAVADKG